ncbi:hypothetical protein G6N05_07770 [Flavobacterium sp. F372]|uniref:Lipoprotein n=1 Tax=Flavobacterium bernardetii TaxID=2813823 RepID=A0ABR7IXJ0_9FLAO|nr:hypothetical protein [Flavobacterium bernardetii]MBC5834357.1 hypothetical protein [Flavobacterium bernardetii]NHF70004.1 hypothetical protein [Flavobacterium bernardetii]
MKKYHYILIVLLGFILMPSSVMACGKSSEKHTCKKEISSSKTEKMSCCNNDASSEKDNKGCQGTCDHSDCSCSSTCSSTPLNLLLEVVFQNSTLNDSIIEKAKFSYSSPSILDGFHSIWVIPKIS